MAASPMALFPFIRILFTVNLYRHFRAYQRAYGAAGAIAIILIHGWQVAGGIQFFGDANSALGAEENAYLAALAKLLVYFDVSLGHSPCLSEIIGITRLSVQVTL